jgi:hypothetical protein
VQRRQEHTFKARTMCSTCSVVGVEEAAVEDSPVGRVGAYQADLTV